MNKRLLSLVCSAVMIAAAVVPASAATRKPIKELKLKWTGTITPRMEIGEEDLEFTTGTRNTEVTDKESYDTSFYWTEGDKPKYQVEVTADEGYYFKFNAVNPITVANGTYLSRELSDDKTVVWVRVELPEVKASAAAAAESAAAETVVQEKPGHWELQNGIWRFLYDDGTFAAGCWKYINYKWYWFHANGDMATGWQLIGGEWYYLDPVNGDMWANRTTPDGYRLDINGRIY